MMKIICNNLASVLIFKWLFLVSSIIFISGLIVGFMYTDLSVAEIERLSRPRGYYDIFSNNLLIGYLTVIGMISFGLSSIYVLFFNGVILGTALKVSMGYLDNLGQALLLLLPHGITELIAIIISGALGFLFLRNAILIFRQKKQSFINMQEIRGVIVGLILIFILLGISALIEFYITPDITDYIS